MAISVHLGLSRNPAKNPLWRGLLDMAFFSLADSPCSLGCMALLGTFGWPWSASRLASFSPSLLGGLSAIGGLKGNVKQNTKKGRKQEKNVPKTYPTAWLQVVDSTGHPEHVEQYRKTDVLGTRAQKRGIGGIASDNAGCDGRYGWNRFGRGYEVVMVKRPNTLDAKKLKDRDRL
jgi:hypothetical protein